MQPSKKDHFASIDFLFGTLGALRNKIFKLVSDENVRSELIRDVDRALSWWPVVFSDDKVSTKHRRIVLTSVRRQRNRRAVAVRQSASDRLLRKRL